MVDPSREPYGRNIILIGASAGGVQALSLLVARLPRHLPAAVFIVLHVHPHAPSNLASMLGRNSGLLVKEARDRDAIKHSTIYVAVPDHHLLVDRGYIRVVHGPKENFHRPSIDTLFRSAARAYGSSCVGVILTGAREDGAAGMTVLKSRGAIAIVQDPSDALYPSMPSSGLQNFSVDHRVPLEKIPELIVRLAAQPAREDGEFPGSDELNTDAQLVEQEICSKEMISSVQKLGKVSTLTCPECHGALWEINDPHVLRFRCHVGHAYSSESLLSGQDTALELALWSALRALEENLLLAQPTLERARAGNLGRAQALLERPAAEAEHQASIIRQVLLDRKQDEAIQVSP